MLASRGASPAALLGLDEAAGVAFALVGMLLKGGGRQGVLWG